MLNKAELASIDTHIGLHGDDITNHQNGSCLQESMGLEIMHMEYLGNTEFCFSLLYDRVNENIGMTSHIFNS